MTDMSENGQRLVDAAAVSVATVPDPNHAPEDQAKSLL